MNSDLTPRIKKLREALMRRGFENRSGEWFVKNQLPDTAKMYPLEHVIVRRAYAIDEMLKAIVDGVKVEGKERMKAFKEILSADEAKDLVAFVRKMKA